MPEGIHEDMLCHLPLRMRDSLFLHTVVALEVLHTSPKESKLSWDLSQSINYPKKKYTSCTGHVPCFSTTHYIWNAHAGRIYTGLEQLDMQGFNTDRLMLTGEDPVTGEPISISDCELRFLSGNTITVPIIGALLGLLKVVTAKSEAASKVQGGSSFACHGDVFFLKSHVEDVESIPISTPFDVLPPFADKAPAASSARTDLGCSDRGCRKSNVDDAGSTTHEEPFAMKLPEESDAGDETGGASSNCSSPQEEEGEAAADIVDATFGQTEKDNSQVVEAEVSRGSGSDDAMLAGPVPTGTTPYLLPHQKLLSHVLCPGSPVRRVLVDYPTGCGKTLMMLNALDNFFEDPRAKLIIFPAACVARNFYQEILRWPNRYRDYFACLCPDEVRLACGNVDWHTVRHVERQLSGLADEAISMLCGALRNTLDMKGLIKRGDICSTQTFAQMHPDETMPGSIRFVFPDALNNCRLLFHSASSLAAPDRPGERSIPILLTLCLSQSFP